MTESERVEVPEDLRANYEAATELVSNPTFSGCAIKLRDYIERIARAEAQVRSLTERLQRMGRPVTDEEWESATDHCPCEGKAGEDMSYYEYYKGAVNALIAARMESK